MNKNKKKQKKHSDQSSKIKPLSSKESLASVGNWGIKIQNLFNSYLAEYETLPSYKKVLTSMIKFENMYLPIRKGSTYIDPFRHLAAINEQRKLKRAQIYMNKRDIINTFDPSSGKRLIITSRGHKVFYKDFPLAILRKKQWDGWWTLVMYDFPEKIRVQRRLIRRRLINIGFGSPQISILVSPLSLEKPIQQLIEAEKIKKYIWVLRAKQILGMENNEVACRAWPIETLNLLYKKLLEVLPKIKKGEKLTTQWKHYFLAVNNADPYLPFELLPEDWQGEKCQKEFIKLGGAGFLQALFAKMKMS